MKTKAVLFIALIAIVSCAKVPVSGRRQLNLLPESTLNAMALTEYKTFLTQNTVVPSSDANAQMVKRVGQRIADAATTYMRTHGQAKRIAGYKWEFNLVQDPTVNAWCMPGGKVVVYSGILPLTQTETGLAVVLGHEISHAIANHGNERMSQQLGVQAGQVALEVALSQKPAETRNIFLQSYGVGANLGLLKYSRVHESEADHIGLIFMAMAGYNPNDAVAFWQRMQSQSSGTKPPEFLSTHPSDATRISDIKKWMPEAMKQYKPSSTTPATPTQPSQPTKPTTPKSGRG